MGNSTPSFSPFGSEVQALDLVLSLPAPNHSKWHWSLSSPSTLSIDIVDFQVNVFIELVNLAYKNVLRLDIQATLW